MIYPGSAFMQFPVNVIFIKIYCIKITANLCGIFSLADLGGRAGCTPSPLDPILSFSHTFSPKSTRIGGPRPPNGCTPLLWEILDLPLLLQGWIQGGPWGPGPPLTTKNEAPAPKFYKTEAPEWQF